MKKSMYLFLIFLYLLGCKSPQAEQPETPKDIAGDSLLIQVNRSQFEQNQMIIAGVISVEAAESITTTGIVDVPPESRVEISPIMGGYVSYNPLLVGNHVKKGQLLMSLENPDFIELQQNYLEVKEQLNYLREEYERNKKLLEEQITSAKNFLHAESNYLSANARYHGLRKQLQLLHLNPDTLTPETISPVFNIYTPISGFITRIGVSRGSYAQPSQAAMEIVNTEHLHLELNVFEKDVLRVRKGQHIEFTVPEASAQTYPAEVHLMSNALSDNRTIRVHAHINDSLKNQLIVGMYIEAQIYTETPSGNSESLLAAPTSSIVEKEGRYYILILEGENEAGYTFRITEIHRGNEIDDHTLIQDPQIAPNTRVLSKGAFDLIL